MEEEPQLDHDEPTIFEVLRETALLPLRILLSKRALKTYLSTILLGLAGSVIYAIGVLAYLYFYYKYIPQLSFTVPVHLQFDHLTHNANLDPLIHHPYGVSALTTSGSPLSSSLLVSQQDYDFTVHLDLPRTPGNIEAGNFMLSLSLLGPLPTSDAGRASRLALSEASTADLPVLAHSSRPATLTYTSPLLSLAHKAAFLPLYLTKFKHETENLHIPLMEHVRFDKGWRNVPKALRLEVKSRERLQIYGCDITATARLSGIRWWMYNHRVISFVVFTSGFWGLGMGSLLTVWGLASLLLPSGRKGNKTKAIEGLEDEEVEGKGDRRRIKREDEDSDLDTMSDTSRSFPTFSRQPPLHYSSSSSRTKQEPGEDAGKAQAEEEGAAAAAADVSATDTDEDADFVLQEPESVWQSQREFRDSGLGTSYESGSGSNLSRRRGSGRRGSSK